MNITSMSCRESPRGFIILFKNMTSFIEKHSLVFALSFFTLGIVVTAWLPSLGKGVSNGIGVIINFYAYFVPFLLYFLLTPALIKILELAEEYGNGWLFSVLKQFVIARVLVILFAISMLSFFFGLPFHLNGNTTFSGALVKVINQLVQTLIFSTFLYGVYAAIVTFFIAQKFVWIKSFFHRVGDGIEYVGEFLTVLTPLFMFAIGSFLYHLPFYLQTSLAENKFIDASNILQVLNLNFFGLNMLPKEFVFIGLYLSIGLMTGVLCFIWHGLYIAYTRLVNKNFDIIYYLKNYWLKIYPLLWSSSSETLAVPLSLSLMKRRFPEVPSGIRQFVIAGGSYLGINGTLISVYVMGIILAMILGVQISFLQLLFSIPVIFILGYAVPGIPGELVIFAGSMSILLGIPANILPLFLALYLTMQIGLPDSFRTGCNSTDSALVAIASSSKLEFYQKNKKVETDINNK